MTQISADEADGSSTDVQHVSWRGGEWGRSRSVSIRLIFFGAERCPYSLDHIRRLFASEKQTAREQWRFNDLAEPSHSMHEDIVAPQFAVDGKLPLLLACEKYGAPDNRAVSLTIKSRIDMDWEGRLSTLSFPDEAAIRARFVDGFCIFENGSVAYHISFVFEPEEGGTMPFPAPLLLVLESVWGMSAGNLATEEAVTLEWAGQKAKTLQEFLRRRLVELKKRPLSDSSLFGLLEAADDVRGASGLNKLVPVLASFFEKQSQWTGKPTSVDIEVLGLDRHREVIQCAEAAEKRTLEASNFAKMLAGLAQNVFDFGEQDRDELCDSLSSSVLVGDEIAFANRGLSLRFSSTSRPYLQWRHKLGGSPYLLLVELIAGHNRLLLGEVVQADALFSRSVKTKATSRQEIAAKLNSARDLQEQLDFYIPNVFRYQTERGLYALFSRAWDLDTQYGALRRSQQTRELAIQRDDEALKEIESRLLNRRLLGVGVIQIGGALAAVVSVQPGDRAWVWPLVAAIMALGALAFVPQWMIMRFRSASRPPGYSEPPRPRP